jgi:hypothetical protein
VEHFGKYYTFASYDNAVQFKKNVDHYMQSVYTSVTVNPELIILLNMTQVLPNSIIIESSHASKKKSTVAMVDSELQTEVHAVESYIDPQYEFSQWKLRKRALKIADLRNKVTHSAQTEMSHFRRENETQVYLPKGKGTQTAKEAGTNPIKHMRYIQGLRGKPDQKMSIVNIKLELDGPK